MSNRKGLFIIVDTEYNKKVEQWRFCIKDDTYREYYPSLCQIGCSLEKSYEAIVNDLRNRLFIYESAAYKKLKNLSLTKVNKNSLIENRKHVIESLKKVINIKPNRHHNGNYFDILKEDDYIMGSLDHLHDKLDLFNLSLKGVSSEDIIKIMGILAQKQKV